jgi:hypothetical protein
MHFKSFLATIVLLAALPLTGCGLSYVVKGQVVDAVTKQPIQGAVVAIHWYRYSWGSYIAPLASGHQTVADADDITDANGLFTIPRYHHITTGGHDIGVYKEGYVCWYNEKIFIPEGKTNEQMFVPRKDPGVYDGMVIELEPIKRQGFPSYEHAQFVGDVRRQVRGTRFSEATIKESRFERKEYRKRMGIDK